MNKEEKDEFEKLFEAADIAVDALLQFCREHDIQHHGEIVVYPDPNDLLGRAI